MLLEHIIVCDSFMIVYSWNGLLRIRVVLVFVPTMYEKQLHCSGLTNRTKCIPNKCPRQMSDPIHRTRANVDKTLFFVNSVL